MQKLIKNKLQSIFRTEVRKENSGIKIPPAGFMMSSQK